MKCSKCKKLKPITIECRCEKSFCLKCKSPEDHDCKFDYKKSGKEKIKKNNPTVVKEKIEKI